jgi:DNA-binding PadR family transcriptional regulator
MGKHWETMRPLAVVSLALLAERPMHPYEMYQVLLARGQDTTVKLRPGTLYHVVGWLLDSGLVVATGTDRDGNRPERTTYAITSEGRRALEVAVKSMISSPQPEYSDFTVAIGEAHTLPLEAVLDLLKARLAALAAERDRGQALFEEAHERHVPRRYVLSGDYALNRANADIAWLTNTIAQLESGDLSWDEPFHHKKETP